MHGLLAVTVGRRGGKARSRNLSPERRREIARWARFIRGQKERGQVTVTEQMGRVIQLIRAADPDLAALLKATSRMPMKYSERICQIFSDEEKHLIERSWVTACQPS